MCQPLCSAQWHTLCGLPRCVHGQVLARRSGTPCVGSPPATQRQPRACPCTQHMKGRSHRAHGHIAQAAAHHRGGHTGARRARTQRSPPTVCQPGIWPGTCCTDLCVSWDLARSMRAALCVSWELARSMRAALCVSGELAQSAPLTLFPGTWPGTCCTDLCVLRPGPKRPTHPVSWDLARNMLSS